MSVEKKDSGYTQIPEIVHQVKKIKNLMSMYYNEEKANKWVLDYMPEFLKWSLEYYYFVNNETQHWSWEING